MTLQNIKKLRAEKGFTIVELLIVIVVIGILAAIVIVAYNGIQNQAKTQSGKAAASNLQKKIEAYNAASTASSYPLSAANGAALETTLNGVTESRIGSSINIGVPTSTNGQSTVQVEYCDTGANDVVAAGSRIIILASGTTCSAWDTPLAES